MYSIVPLAGPDFILPNGSLKPLFKIDGISLIEKALKSRFWFQNGELETKDLIFILRDTERTPDFKAFLEKTFIDCKTLVISNITKGALLSSLAGCALIDNYNKPVCVDLVDIIYDCSSSPQELFKKNSDLSGIIPYFKSDNPKFSYLTIENEMVQQTVEKKVISNNASAGTYFFKDLPTFLRAASGSLKVNEILSYKGNMFLCPSYNPLILNGEKIVPFEVSGVISLSEIFHS